MYVYAPCACSTLGGQKKAVLVPLELEIQMTVSDHVDTGNLTLLL